MHVHMPHACECEPYRGVGVRLVSWHVGVSGVSNTFEDDLHVFEDEYGVNMCVHTLHT